MKRVRNSLLSLAASGAAAVLLTAGVAAAQDTTPPTITSIVRQTPTGQTLNTTSVVFTVTFSEAVTGVNSDWFVVTPMNGGTATGAVASVTGGPAVYQVAVNLTSGTGEFRLDVPMPISTTTTFATFRHPTGLVFDGAGNLYVGESGDVIKVTPNGEVSNFVSGVSRPQGLAFDGTGNLYVVSSFDGTVSKVTPNGAASGFASGFNYPVGLAFDAAGNLYVANSGDNTVSKVTTNGTVSLFASGFSNPAYLAFDNADNLYVANRGDNTVSKVTTNGTVSTFASGFSEPIGVAFDRAGNLYVANAGDDTVSKVTTNGIVSTFASGFFTSGLFNLPSNLAFDSAGHLYVADIRDTVIKITIFEINDLAGNALTGLPYTNGTSYIYVPNSAPTDLALSGSSISQSTGVNGVVGTLSTTDAGDTFTYTLVTGTGDTDNASFNLSGATLRANNAAGLAVGNYSVRIRTTDSGGATYEEAFTIAVVDGVPPTVVSITRKSPAIQAALTNTAVFTVTFSEAVTGVTTNWFMVAPINGSTVDGLVTEVTGGPVIYDVTVNVLSGSGEFRLNLLKYPMSSFASVHGPSALAFDAAGYLYVSTYDASVMRVDTNGVASTLASGFYGTVLGLTTDAAGNVYVAETGNHTVVRVTPDGTKSNFVTSFTFVCGLAFDVAGNLYTSGFTDQFIRRVDTNGNVSVFSSSVIYPHGLAFDAVGNLYVANGRVTRITTNGVASEFAASFRNPQGLAFDQAGNLYVSDNGVDQFGGGVNTISRVDPNGSVTLILPDFVGGDALSAAIAFDAAGNLYVASPKNNRVSKMTFSSLYDLAGNALIGLPYTNGASYVYGTNAVPTGMALTNNSISQAAAANAVVGTLRTTNNYPSDTFTYALVSGAGDTDNSRFSISGNGLLVNNAGAMAVGAYSVRIRSTESLGLTLETVFAINITDGVPPTLVSITRGSPTVPAISTTNVTFAVTFTEPVISLKLRSFVVTPTSGSVTGTATSITGGPTVYDVAVALSGATGTVRLDMLALTNSVISTFASGMGNPRGLAFDAANNLYAASVTGNSVLKVTPGGVVSTFATGFSGPQGLAFDATGNLYVANATSGTISVVTPAGNVSTFATGFSTPQGLAFGPAGNLYVANATSGTISVVTPAGNVSTFVAGFTTPTALVFDGAGNLFVSDTFNGTVSRVTPAGNVSTFATGLGQPYSLAMDAQGNLYVGNSSVVNVIATNGVTRLFASGVNQARGLAFDSAGDLYGTRTSGSTVRKFILNNAQDLAGNLLTGVPYTSGDSYTYTPPVAPTIALSTNIAFYTLGDAAALLDPLANCAAGSAAFAGGQLSVTLVSNAEPRDVLGVFHQGTAPGEIGVSSSQITFGGSTIAAFSGVSTGATSLTFTFNANADASGVQQLLRNLTYLTVTNRPTAFTRTLEFSLVTGSLTSAPVQLTVELNYRPTASGDRIATGTNLPVFVSYARLLANDSDYDGDAFVMLPINTNTASGGTLTLETNGVTFTPTADFSGAAGFAYQLQDDRGGLSMGGVYVQVLNPGQLFIEALPRDAVAISNQLALAIMDLPGRTYRVLASDDLSAWAQVGTAVTPQSGLVRYYDADALNHTNRFYRTVYP